MFIQCLHLAIGSNVQLLPNLLKQHFQTSNGSCFRFKDFASEVRGNMDVESLLDDAAVLLDLTETSLERIIHTILNKTLDILEAPLAYEEAMSTLFLPESGNILAKTIQVGSWKRFNSPIDGCFKINDICSRGRLVLMEPSLRMISLGF